MRKKKRDLSLLLMAILLMGTAGCSSDDEVANQPEPIVPQPEVEHLVSFTKSDCKATIMSEKDYVRYVRDNGLERFEYKALPDGQLLLSHINVPFFGDSDTGTPEVSFNGNTLKITEHLSSKSDGATEMYDLEYVIQSFSEGEYTIDAGNQNFSINYSANLEGEYQVFSPDHQDAVYACCPEKEYIVRIVVNPTESESTVAEVLEAPEEALDSLWPCKKDTLQMPKMDYLVSSCYFPDKEYAAGEKLTVRLHQCHRNVYAPTSWVVDDEEYVHYKDAGYLIQFPLNSIWVPYCEMSRKEMPQWLSLLCDESARSEKPLQLFEGNCNGEPTYMFINPLESEESVLAYNQNGTQVNNGTIAFGVDNVSCLLIINMETVCDFSGGHIYPYTPEKQDEMPSWLSSFVNDSQKNVPETTICQGVSEGRAIFYIYAPYMSSYAGMLYDESGEVCNHDIWDGVKGWKCIYKR